MSNIMPAKTPPISEDHAARLAELGSRIRAQRLKYRISTVSAAEAAGMSRATYHRIERGEPSVTMGAYLSAIDAVGLVLEVRDPAAPPLAPSPALPQRIRLSDYPQLARLAWQLHGADELTPTEALAIYERNWRHVDEAAMEPTERALVHALRDHLAGGRLLV